VSEPTQRDTVVCGHAWAPEVTPRCPLCLRIAAYREEIQREARREAERAEAKLRRTSEHAAAGLVWREGCDAYPHSPEPAYSFCRCPKLPVLERAKAEGAAEEQALWMSACANEARDVMSDHASREIGIVAHAAKAEGAAEAARLVDLLLNQHYSHTDRCAPPPAPEQFCEAFGCSTLRKLLAAIRALAEPQEDTNAKREPQPQPCNQPEPHGGPCPVHGPMVPPRRRARGW
jgi:hypothetical protein